MSDLNRVLSGDELYDIVFERMNIYFFRYDISKRTIFIPEKTQRVFGCKSVYEDVQTSFVNEFVAEEYRESFIHFCEECHSGKEGEYVFEDKDHTFLLCVKLQITERDENGKPIMAIGIVENQIEIKKLLDKRAKYIDTILSNAVGYFYKIGQLYVFQFLFRNLTVKPFVVSSS